MESSDDVSKNESSNKPVEINLLTLDEEETQYVTIHQFGITTNGSEQNYVSVTV